MSYNDATEQAQRFAQQTGQAHTKATRQFSELARVAGAVGQGGNLDKIQQGFADLAAAHLTSSGEVLESVVTGREAGLRVSGIFDIKTV